MRKITIVVLLCLMSVGVFAETVTSVIFGAQGTGITGNYTYSDGQLSWTEGTFAYIYTDGGGSSPFLTFNKVGLTFDCTLDSSSSSAGSGKFDLNGNAWAVDFYLNASDTTPLVTMSGSLNSGRFDGQYWEDISGTNALEGKAWLTVDTITVFDVFELEWYGDNIIGMETDVTIDQATPFADYFTDDYDSTNGVTITLIPDENSVVPEPMTMALLGLGSLLALRKRRV